MKIFNIFSKVFPLLFLCISLCLTVHKTKGHIEDKMLLNHTALQIEVAEGMNAMYNFQFEVAQSIFEKIRQKYPHHPLPYFLFSLNTWWKILPEIENKFYDKIFLQYISNTIQYAHNLYKNNNNNYESHFFLSAAYALKGRLLGERNQWIKAALAGKKALKYYKKTKEKHNLSAELLFGKALYHYYSAWVYENYAIFRLMKVFVPKEDATAGIAQLKRVAQNAFYTKTEAQYYLLGILVDDLHSYEEALPLASYLYHTFPQNASFQNYYAKVLYMLGKFDQGKTVSYNILQKIKKKSIGYGEESQRYAHFFLAHMHHIEGKLLQAKHFYHKIKIHTEKRKKKNEQKGYYLYAILGLAEIAEKEKEFTLAYKLYRKINSITKKKITIHQKSKKKMVQIKKILKSKKK